MTKDFDPVTEFPIHTSEFGEGLLLLKDVVTCSIIIFIIVITIIYEFIYFTLNSDNTCMYKYC